MTYLKLREMANDAEILYALADVYDCDDMNLVQAYISCKDGDPVFTALCSDLLNIRNQGVRYDKALANCVKEFPDAASRINIDVIEKLSSL